MIHWMYIIMSLRSDNEWKLFLFPHNLYMYNKRTYINLLCVTDLEMLHVHVGTIKKLAHLTWNCSSSWAQTSSCLRSSPHLTITGSSSAQVWLRSNKAHTHTMSVHAQISYGGYSNWAGGHKESWLWSSSPYHPMAPSWQTLQGTEIK